MAGAIEAVGSTGSMIMPPVMGAAAFIIPEMIGGTYVDVVRAAIIPGLLFYVALYMVVELQAVKLGLRGFSKSELPTLRILFREKGHMLIPILVLIYFLVIRASTPPRAAFWGAIACILVSQLRRRTGMGFRETVLALEKGAKGTLIVAACCASAGIITGTNSMAGLGEPADSARLLHKVLRARGSGRGFLTLFLARLDAASGALDWVSAAHPSPTVRRAGGTIEELALGAPPLGIGQESRAESGTTRLEPGDLLLLFTDGLYEAVGADGQPFGWERVRSEVAKGGSAAELAARMLAAFDRHLGPEAPSDDLALVVVERGT